MTCVSENQRQIPTCKFFPFSVEAYSVALHVYYAFAHHTSRSCMKPGTFLASEYLKPDTAIKELTPVSSSKSSQQDRKHNFQPRSQ